MKKKEWVCAVALACFIAAALQLVYLNVAGAVLGKLGEWHAAHLLNEAAAPLQYRWISYAVPALLTSWGVELVNAYLAARIAYLAAAFIVIYRLVRELEGEPLAPALISIGVGLFYAASTQPFLQPSEEPNLLVFALFIYFAMRKASVWTIAAIVAFGALNKDTVGFLLPWYFLLHWSSSDRKLLVVRDAFFVSFIFVSIYIGLRVHFGTERAYLGGVWQVGENIIFLKKHPMHGLMWTLPSLVPLLFVVTYWRQMPLYIRCFIPSLLLFVLGHWMISRIEEFRTYTPLAVMMWPAVLSPFLVNRFRH